jgi:hypothetical protein
MSKITSCLWFNGEAEEAANFYVSLLPDSKIEIVQRNSPDGAEFLVSIGTGARFQSHIETEIDKRAEEATYAEFERLKREVIEPGPLLPRRATDQDHG